MQQYEDVFGEIGYLQGEHHISIDPKVKPVIHPPRKIPISMLEKLKAELERIQQLDVLDKIDEPTDWVSSLVMSSPRFRCLVSGDLNKAIKREHHLMPTVDEIQSKLGGSS